MLPRWTYIRRYIMLNFFTIFHNFVNLSHNLKDYGMNTETITVSNSAPLYIGYEKPFNQFFIAFDTPNTVNSNLTIEFFNGTEYEEVSYKLDETDGFKNDGFIIFKKPTTWEKGLVEQVERYYIRITSSAEHSATVVKGIGVLFSNDNDLVAVRSNIVEKYNNGLTWLGKHEQAQKEIIQALNNKGYRKVKNDNDLNPLVEEGIAFADINRFDILEPAQLRMVSTYLVLSMIYLDELSDEENDKWYRQGKRYEEKFYKAFNLFTLKIDTNDDGVAQDNEGCGASSTGLTWI